MARRSMEQCHALGYHKSNPRKRCPLCRQPKPLTVKQVKQMFYAMDEAETQRKWRESQDHEPLESAEKAALQYADAANPYDPFWEDEE